jgi:hypothetical protein
MNLIMKLFLKTILILTAVSTALASDLPDFEPTRIWQGKSYAETLVEYFRRNHPDIPVIIDRNDLREFSGLAPDVENYSTRAIRAQLKENEADLSKENSLPHRLTTLGRSIIPKPIASLTHALEIGQYIYLTEEAETRNQKADAFRAWIISQPDSSIEPHVLMSKALEINNGRLIAAWAMAWNVLSENWGAAAVRNYSTFTRKMVSITGERQLWQSAGHVMVLPDNEKTIGDSQRFQLDERGNKINIEELKDQPRQMRLAITKRGDEFSYLYHRIGVELLAMITSDYFGSKMTGSLLAKAGAVAEWLKFTKTAGIRPERKKRVINDVLAGTSGVEIAHLFKKNKSTRFKDKELSASNYLKPNKFLYGGEYLLDEGRPSIYEGSEINPKYWDKNVTVEELRLRFEYGTRYDSDALDMILLLATGDYEELHKGLVKYLNSKENDPVLNKYLDEYLQKNVREGFRVSPAQKDIAVDFDLSLDLNKPFIEQAHPDFDLDRAKETWARLIQRVLITKGHTPTYNSCLKVYGSN